MAAVLPDTTVLWTPVGQSQVLDDRAAAAAGHVGVDGQSPPHGTYTVIKTYRLRLHDAKIPGPAAQILVIFDDAGNFARFEWDEPRQIWRSEHSTAEFSIGAGAYPFEQTMKTIEAASVTRAPSLGLATYDAANVPSGGKIGHFFIADQVSPGQDEVIEIDTVEGSFTWRHAGDTDGLKFKAAPTQPRAPSVPDTDQFGYIFRDIGINQVAMPFYGFDPRKVLVYPSGDRGYLGSPGTSGVSYAGNPQQTFNGQLVFEFPRYDSGDYTRGQDAEAPTLPLGLTLVPIHFATEDTHSATISSLDETMNSWSVTLGLSGGVKEMLSMGADATYGTRVDIQKKAESRYTVTRKLGIAWVASLYPPSLVLHAQLVKSIKSLTARMLAEKPRFKPGPGAVDPLPWASFVDQFGTHYCHAMTQGSTTFAETRFSLASESQAFDHHLDLSAEASAGIGEGGTGDLTAAVKQHWASKNVTEVSTTDITSFTAGDKAAMAIFLDLRPLTELLGPIHFPYNPYDDWGQFAPFVWYDLRDRLNAHLEGLGLNQPLGPEWSVDYTPRRIAVTAPGITLTLDGDGPETLNIQPGTIKLEAAAAPAASLYGEGAFALLTDQQESLVFSDHDVPADGSLLIDATRPRCFVAAKPGETSVTVAISGSLAIYDVYSDDTGAASFYKTTIDLTKDVVLNYGETATVRYPADGCTLTLDLLATDAGPLGSPPS